MGSWREGGGRNLNVVPSPSEADSKPSEESGVGRGTPSPSGDSDEANKPSAGEGREKRDARDRVPPAGPQHKLNGGQQPPPGGMSSQFHAQFRSMMPPYVSNDIILPLFNITAIFLFCCFPIIGHLIARPLEMFMLNKKILNVL